MDDNKCSRPDLCLSYSLKQSLKQPDSKKEELKLFCKEKRTEWTLIALENTGHISSFYFQ